MFAVVRIWLFLVFFLTAGLPVKKPVTPVPKPTHPVTHARLAPDTLTARAQQAKLDTGQDRWTRIDRKPTRPEKPEGSDDRVLSPYFFVSTDTQVDAFPLKQTSVHVQISGVIADVLVSQTYENRGRRPLECVYVFPASTKAAVYRMEMTIGQRRLVAQIAKREDARKTYERARREGRTASLLEQERPNVFQMKVANILPGDVVRTDLYYTELLVPEKGIYQLVYPTVVGPRYSHRPKSTAPDSEKWVESPYLHSGQLPQSRLALQVDISTAVPLWDLACPSHDIDARFPSASTASVRLAANEVQGANRDFILKYRLTGEAIASGLLLKEGPEENFFLAMIQPPRRSAVTRAPMEYIFVVDVSGSMHGYPLEISKELLRNLLGSLGPHDLFNVVLFSGRSALLNDESLPATPAHIQAAIQLIEAEVGSGGTEILPALETALMIPSPKTPMGRTVVIATDGYVDVEQEVFDLISSALGNANFFAFGIGTSVNRYIIEGMARVGKGEPFVVTGESQARSAAADFATYVGSPILSRAEVQFEGLDAYDVDPPQLPDLFAERPLIITGKWRGVATGRIRLSGVSGKGDWRETLEVARSEPSPAHAALRYLWARERIAVLSDYNQSFRETDDRISQITDLGLRYSLMTKYTSFVAVDTVARTNQKPTTVAQPLPLPEGVSDLAVGNHGGSASVVKLDESRFAMPARIAKSLPAPPMDSVPEYSNTAGGVPGGLVGGVPGGVVGGVLGGVPKSASPPPPPLPPVGIKSPIRVGGNVQASKLIKRVEAKYPELARQARVQGMVLLKILVDASGNVVEIHVVSGHPLLVEAAVEAVKQWKYRPTLLNGEAVPVIAIATVNFVLR